MLDSLAAQTVVPDRIVVLINNCTDDTPELAAAAGAEVLHVPPSPHKKAGALNWWLDENLAVLETTDQILEEATGDRLGTAAFKAHLETRYLSA